MQPCNTQHGPILLAELSSGAFGTVCPKSNGRFLGVKGMNIYLGTSRFVIRTSLLERILCFWHCFRQHTVISPVRAYTYSCINPSKCLAIIGRNCFVRIEVR